MAFQLLHPGRNVWRVEKAGRAKILIDGAAFFRAVRDAFLNARHSIFVLGWDIDSRARLVGEDARSDDGYPADLRGFLTELVRRRPGLQVNLLLWDYSLLYAGERELFPRLSLQWSTPEQVRLCLDNVVPFGSSQHQKIVVVDNALAFSGGLDLTIRRWDTTEHAPINPHRVDPAGTPFEPFHDVQMMVDGDAARALAEIACERWSVASGCKLEDTAPLGNPWPAACQPDFTDVQVGIARTQPAYHGRAEAREVTHLFMDAIRAAQRSIYIENQFVTSEKIARCLASRLRENKHLEVLIVAPRRYESWIEAKTMRNARIRFWQIVKEAGGERVRLMYPDVAQDGKSTCTMIHSKVMVVDDWFLRIGSANMNDRSMGADSECDLAIEAQTPAERAAILDIRNRLLGEHCGLSAAATARALEEHGQSMLAVADRVSGNGHSLRPIDDGEPENSELLRYLEEIADPPEPLRPSKVGRRLIGHLRNAGGGAAFKVALIALLAGALTLAWYGSPLADWVEVKKVGQWLRVAGSQPWGGGIVIAGFILGGLVCFPVTVLIAATAAVFGPWYGFAYAFLGVIGSALTTYGIGLLFGRGALQQMLGEKLDRLHARLKAQGVLAIAAIRAIPIAPFTIVNLAAGATGIRLTDYVAGTVLGMLPGLVVMAVLGHQIVALVSNPSIRELSLLAIGIVGWVLLTLGVQKLISMQWRSGR